MLKKIQKKIYLLLFLGLFYFENSTNLIAQVPQTKRSEQDSFLKNIRAKKKNNDLQKTRQGRKKSNSTDEYTFRYLSGKGQGRGKLKESDMYTYTSVEILHLKFENWGFGIGKYSGSGCRDNDDSGIYTKCNNNLTDRPWYNGYVNAINYSYTFGNSIFITLMGNIYAQGKATNLHGDNGNELEMNEVTFSFHNFSLPIIVHQFQFGFKISNLEFIIASDFSTFEFSKDNGYCFENSEGLEECDKNKVIFNAGGVTLVGLGFVF